MYAVGMLGSYLTQGVYAVAGPFQPFGGAVDIIVVQQEDGTFKSSPWYVKFGDYQTPFKSREREKVVDISVNDVPADFHMFLDYNGEAYFEKEVDTEDEIIGSQSSQASSEGASVLDVAEGECSETNDLGVHGDDFLITGSSIGASDVEKILISGLSFESSSDGFDNLSDERKCMEIQEAYNAISADVTSKAEEELADSTTEMNYNGVSHVHEIVITESNIRVLGNISKKSGEIQESQEALGHNASSVVEIFSNGDGLSLLQPQESDDPYLGMETTHISNTDNRISLINTEDQEDQLKSGLWVDTHSVSVLGTTGISNEGEFFMTVVNDDRGLDRGDDAVLVNFKSTQAEPDIALTAYDFDQLILEEREDWSVENPSTDELSTELTSTSASILQVSESTDTSANISELIPSEDEKSGVESTDLDKQVEEEASTEEAVQHEKHQIVVSSVTSSSKWSLWPLSFRRSRMEKVPSAGSNHTLLATTRITPEFPPAEELTQNNGWTQKTKVRTYVPTSTQLASLDLRDGPNKVTFTSVLGKTEVDARIYLWKWNARIVISDVDGTITKSDVLGQVMPLVGRDWSQYGVTRLFSAIKDNGFQVLFLSARAISQAYLTRKFLLNLKQDGEALPEGPVFISPDGLLPSLYREVIRRAPHEFKISCLEAIRELFPKDVNPFYAGFGNRITDEISYLKVGIPKGKIFIINPKGEVVVDHRVDRKSYTSLHALVDDMFPPLSSHEQEDFNSWNYWKMPLLDIDDEISGKSSKNSKKTKK